MSSGHAARHAKAISDLDIQEWVFERHGFVPHPFWITHCRELYLSSPIEPEGRPAWHECPRNKRAAIREAFLNFGMLCE